MNAPESSFCPLLFSGRNLGKEIFDGGVLFSALVLFRIYFLELHSGSFLFQDIGGGLPAESNDPGEAEDGVQVFLQELLGHGIPGVSGTPFCGEFFVFRKLPFLCRQTAKGFFY